MYALGLHNPLISLVFAQAGRSLSASLGQYLGLAEHITVDLEQGRPATQVLETVRGRIEGLDVIPDLADQHAMLQGLIAGRYGDTDQMLDPALRILAANMREHASRLMGQRGIESLPPSMPMSQPMTSRSPRSLSIPPQSISSLRGSIVPGAESEQIQAIKCVGTVIFVDMAGFTKATSGMDPEGVSGFINRMDEALDEVLLRHGGIFVKSIGDAIMGVFGIKVQEGRFTTYDDHAISAGHAALDMFPHLEALNRQLSAEGISPIAIRIGIDTGPLIVAYTGGLRMKAIDVVGNTVTMASRCESLKASESAATGDFDIPLTNRIVMTERTVAELQGLFECRHIGPFPFKGAPQPVDTYLLNGIKPEQSVIRARGEAAATFRGRDLEMLALNETLDVVNGGTPQLITIEAHGGQGKSRLVTEFLRQAHDHDGRPVRILATKGEDRDAHPLYYYIANAFRPLFYLESDDDAEQIEYKIQSVLRENFPADKESLKYKTHLLAYLLGYQLSDVPERFTELLKDPTQLKSVLQEAVLELIQGLARKETVIFALEDIQWADSESLELIRSLNEAISRSETETPTRVMSLVVSRPQFSEEHPDFFVGNYVRPTLHLKPLSYVNLVEIAHDLIKDAIPSHLSDDAIHFIVEQSGQNPYVLHAMARAAREGWLHFHEEDGSWSFINEKQQTVPPDAASFLQARITNLGGAEQQLLRAAAILGDEIHFDSLRALGIANPAHTLERLINKEFISRGRNERYAFRHAMIRETVLSLMESDERARFNRDAAFYYQTLPDHDAVLIAAYLEAGQRPAQAAHYYIQAADARRAGGFNREAMTFYRRAYDHAMESGLWSQALKAISGLVPAVINRQDVEQYATLLELINGFNEITLGGIQLSREEQAEIRFNRGVALRLNKQYKDACDEYTNGLSFYEEGEATKIKYKLLNALAGYYRRWHQPRDYEKSAEYTRHSIEIAQKIDDAESLGDAWINLSNIAIYMDNYSEAYQAGTEAATIHEANSNYRGLIAAINNIASALMVIGDYTEARRQLELGIEVSSMKLNDASENTHLLPNYGETLRLLGHPKEAVALLEGKALPNFIAADNDFMHGATHVYAALAQIDAGNPIRARDHAKQALSIAGKTDQPLAAMALTALAKTYIISAAAEEALNASTAAYSLYKDMGGLVEFDSLVLLTHAQSLYHCGRYEEAAVIVGEAHVLRRRQEQGLSEAQLRQSAEKRVNREFEELERLLQKVQQEKVEIPAPLRRLLVASDWSIPPHLPVELALLDLTEGEWVDAADSADGFRDIYTSSHGRVEILHSDVGPIRILKTELDEHVSSRIAVEPTDLITGLLTQGTKVDHNVGPVDFIQTRNIILVPKFSEEGDPGALISFDLDVKPELLSTVSWGGKIPQSFEVRMKGSVEFKNGVFQLELRPESRTTRLQEGILGEDMFGRIRLSVSRDPGGGSRLGLLMRMRDFTRNGHVFLRAIKRNLINKS